MTGFHRFFLEPHHFGPFIVHQQLENLYESVNSVAITGASGAAYTVENAGEQHVYHTLSLSFARPFQTPSTDSPFCKIVVEKDSIDESETSITLENRSSHAWDVRYIGSVTLNGSIYILIQNDDEHLLTYKISDFNEYKIKTDDNKVAVGNKKGIVSHRDAFRVSSNFYNSFDTTAVTGNTVTYYPGQHLISSINLKRIIDSESSVRVLGACDDIFKDDKVYNYRWSRRWFQLKPAIICNEAYIPLLCRESHPEGPMHSLLMIISGDDTISITKNEVTYRPVSHPLVLNDNGTVYISNIKLQETENEYTTFASLLDSNEGYKFIRDAFESDYLDDSERLSRRYNMYGNKKWLVGKINTENANLMNTREDN
jgi:hypothetical protein